MNSSTKNFIEVHPTAIDIGGFICESISISMIEEIVDYDPTPQYLYDNDGGEPPISSEEIHSGAWRQHQEFHS